MDPKPEPSDSFERRVLKWLRETGRPLELRVGRELRRRQWLPRHGHWYADPITGKQRELDTLASKTWASSHGFVAFYLAIECKSSREKPWVALVAEGSASTSGRYSTPTVCDEVSRDIVFTAVLKDLAGLSLGANARLSRARRRTRGDLWRRCELLCCRRRFVLR